MNKSSSSIDYKRLESELLEALKADELYKLRNDAKLRAIEQNVPTYECFRQMVNAAHLKPLSSADIKSKGKRSWNSLASTANSSTAVVEKPREMHCENQLHVSRETEGDFANQVPATCEQFARIWEKVKGPEARFSWVKNARHTLKEIFRTEIPATVLVELIDACRENVSLSDNVEPIVDVLYILSSCNRFSLAISFMELKEKERCAQLFRDLLRSPQCETETLRNAILRLASLYEVELA